MDKRKPLYSINIAEVLLTVECVILLKGKHPERNKNPKVQYI